MRSDSLRNLELMLTESDDRLPRLALRPRDAALALGISQRLLWTKTNCGEIPHCRIGRAIIYPVHLLEEYLTKQAKGSDAK